MNGSTLKEKTVNEQHEASKTAKIKNFFSWKWFYLIRKSKITKSIRSSFFPSSRKSRTNEWRRFNSSAHIGTHSMRTGCSSALIAKLLTAFAGHCWATLISFHPEIAFRALFESGSFDEIDKILIVFVECIADFIFGAGHSVVINAFAFEAIMLRAGRAPIIIKFFIKLENSCTASSWAPSGWCIVLLYKFIEAEFLIFFLQIWIWILENISNVQNSTASLHRTDNLRISSFYLGL